MITVGVIGAGYWGKNLVRTFDALETTVLRYIADSSEETLSRYDTYTNALKTNDYMKVIGDASLDAVVIATPPVTHHEIALAALRAGKHVMIEKPMTLSVNHAQELVSAADKSGKKLMVGHLLLYHPCVTALKSFLDSGDLGDIHYLYCQRLNLGKVRSDENALQSLAPHDISVANYLMDDTPVSVSASGQDYLRKGIEDVVFLNILYSGGRMAHVHVSWLDPHKVRRTTVVGSKKMALFDDMEQREKIRIYDKGVDFSGEYGSYGEYLTLREGNIFIPDVRMSEPLKCECEHFIDCIVNDLTPRTDGLNGLAVTQVLSAAQKSLASGGLPVSIEN
jgi:predicted dehydrogenase